MGLFIRPVTVDNDPLTSVYVDRSSPADAEAPEWQDTHCDCSMG